jgi:hypothetical protein
MKTKDMLKDLELIKDAITFLQWYGIKQKIAGKDDPQAQILFGAIRVVTDYCNMHIEEVLKNEQK